MSNNDAIKVCVIGAGLSGLSLAYSLVKHNRRARSERSGMPLFQVVILEARDRIGGRVHPCNISPDPKDPVYVDMGGQWIHEAGPRNPLVQLLTQELHVPLLYQSMPEKPDRATPPLIPNGTYTPEGTRIPADVFHQARKFYARSKQPVGKTTVNINTSFQDLLADAYVRQSGGVPSTFSPDSRLDETRSAESSDEEDSDEDEDEKEENSDDSESTSTEEEEEESGEAPPVKHMFIRRTRSGSDDDAYVTADEDDASTEVSDNSKEEAAAAIHSPLFDQMINYFVHNTECYEGGRIHELSVTLKDLYEEYPGPDEIPVGGYRAVLAALESILALSDLITLRLNCPVQDIYYTPLDKDYDSDDDEATREGVKVKFSTQADMYMSSAALDGSGTRNLRADFCVCTVPLGVLQRDIGFHPPLAQDVQQSIDRIGMGVLDKIMMLFESKFWDDDWFVGVSPPDPTRIQNFSDCSDDYGGKPILASLLGGNVARRFDDEEEGLTDEEVMAEVMTTLRSLFAAHTDIVIPDPISYKISRWLSDPYAYGAYSFTKVGSAAKDYDRVAQPGGKNLFFAGEHTSKHHHSTCHGAWESGVREAERLIRTATLNHH